MSKWSQNRTMLSVRFPLELRERLKRVSNKEGRSQSDILAEAFADWLASHFGEEVDPER